MSADAVAEHLRRHRIAGWDFLGFDPACLAAIDVPEARRLAGLRFWGRVSVGTAAIAGASLAWMAALPWLLPFVAAGFGAFVWNLLRLAGAAGAPTHRGDAAVVAWRPGRGAVVLLLVLGAMLAQPAVALFATVTEAEALAARRTDLAGQFDAAVALPYDDAIAALDADRARVGGALAAELDTRRAAMVAAREADLAAAGPRTAARLAESPMFAAAVALAWSSPLGLIVTGLGALLVASPAIARRAAPVALNQYERVRVRRERARIAQAWSRSEARLVRLLAAWQTFPGQLRALSTDPPFDDRPLLLGFARGTVVPLDLTALRAAIPGYDAASTRGGRARAAERHRLTLQLAAAAGASPEARYHRARTFVARARTADPVDPDAARADAAAALAELDGLPDSAASVAVRARAALLLGDLALAQRSVDALRDARPDHPVAHRLAADLQARLPAPTPEARLARAEAVLASLEGTPEADAARRDVARARLPRGGAEATRLADAALQTIDAEADPRTRAAVLDLISAAQPTRAPASRREAVALLERIWSDDPTPDHALDLARMLHAAARTWTDPYAARLQIARALDLAQAAARARPGERADAIVAAIEGHDPPPVWEEWRP